MKRKALIMSYMTASQNPLAGHLVVPLFAVLMGVGWLGCSTTTSTYTVEVDAINDPTGANGWSYTLAATAPARISADPQYAEVVNRIHVALSQRGMFEAPDPRTADFVISFDYGERAPQTKVTTVNQPVMVQPGMGSGIGGMGGSGISIGGPSIGIGTGGISTGIGTGGINTGYPGGGYPGGSYPGSYPGGGYPGGMGGSGVVMVPTTQITRTSEKYLYISARENVAQQARGGRPPSEVWRVEATLDDESADVHLAIPALVDSVIEYIGTNTGGPQKVRVKLRKS